MDNTVDKQSGMTQEYYMKVFQFIPGCG